MEFVVNLATKAEAEEEVRLLSRSGASFPEYRKNPRGGVDVYIELEDEREARIVTVTKS
jgi:UDP-N-acetylmuramoylalanine-D-glutamate ligase